MLAMVQHLYYIKNMEMKSLKIGLINLNENFKDNKSSNGCILTLTLLKNFLHF